MRTGRLLTACRSLLPGGRGVWSGGVSASWGGCLVWGCLLPGGVWSGGCLLLGGVWSQGGCLVQGCLVLGGVWSRGACLLPGGVWSQGGMFASGGCLVLGGVCLLPGGCLLLGRGIPACTEADTPPPCEQNDKSKNNTLATTSLRPVINEITGRRQSQFVRNLPWVVYFNCNLSLCRTFLMPYYL